MMKLIFTVYYFRNFEESEDELRNDIVESLEKLTASEDEDEKEAASSFSADTENLGRGAECRNVQN